MSGLVSVIVPAYNCADYIAETLGSLRAQHYRHWEAIVVDDGSTDETALIVQEIIATDTRVRYVFQSNAGVSAARNHGLMLANGQYSVFLDADDLLTPHALRAHVENFTKNTDLSISCTGVQYFAHGYPERRCADYSLRHAGVGGNKYFGGGDVTFPEFVRNNYMPLPCAMFSMFFIRKIDGFDESMRALEDWEYVLRCIIAGALILSVREPAALVLVRVRAGSATKTIIFSDYLDRVYGNIRAEITRSLVVSDAVRGRFYLWCLDKQLYKMARKKKIKSERAMISEMARVLRQADSIFVGQWSEWFRLYGVVRVVRAFFKSFFG